MLVSLFEHTFLFGQMTTTTRTSRKTSELRRRQPQWEQQQPTEANDKKKHTKQRNVSKTVLNWASWLMFFWMKWNEMTKYVKCWFDEKKGIYFSFFHRYVSLCLFLLLTCILLLKYRLSPVSSDDSFFIAFITGNLTKNKNKTHIKNERDRKEAREKKKKKKKLTKNSRHSEAKR